MSAANPAWPVVTSMPTRCGYRPSIVARCPAADQSRRRGNGASSSASAASMIVCHPVQRHRWARSAWRTLGSVRCSTGIAAKRRMIPGVQKPHWLAPAAVSRSIHVGASASASSVTTDRPVTRLTGVTHATRAWPSISTVQQPHCPCGAQPSLTLVSPAWSRSASSSEPLAAQVNGEPLSVKSIRSTAAVPYRACLDVELSRRGSPASTLAPR